MRLSCLLLAPLLGLGCERRVVALDGYDTGPSDSGTPCPVLYVSDDTLSWPDASLDGSESQSILLSNLCDGEGDLVMAISLEGDASDAFTFDVGGEVLQPGSTTHLEVSFAPDDLEPHEGVLRVVANSTEPSEVAISLEANAVADADGDGHDSMAADGDDCDDQDEGVYPGADEVWYDGVDNDCDGVVDHVTVDAATGFMRGEAEDYLGYRRSLSLGELNGDGVLDVIAGGMLLGQQGAWQGGVALVSGEGFADWQGEIQGYTFAQVTGDAEQNYLGWMDSRQGDIDGDGSDDVMLLASDNHYSSDGNTAGCIFFSPLIGNQLASEADVVFTGSQSQYSFSGLDRLDVDGDGLNEVFYGDWMQSYFFPGWVLGFAGGNLADGGERNLYWDSDRSWYGGSDGDALGSAMGGGDIDQDGYDDLFMTAPYADVGGLNTGSLYLFYGGLDFDGTGPADQDYALQIHGDSSQDLLGFQSTPQLADFDGDGDLDLAVGAPPIGTVYLWLDVASLTGLEGASSADTTFRSEGAAWFGQTLATGDLDGDGVDDLVVGAPDHDLLTNADTYADQPGEIYVFSGATIEAGTISSGQASQSIAGPSDADLFGITIALGDLSGNGVDELLVAAPRAGGSHEGYVWVFDNL